jgi:hypothetical protein
MDRVRALMVRVVPALLEVDISHPSYQLEEGSGGGGREVRCTTEDRSKMGSEKGRRCRRNRKD